MLTYANVCCRMLMYIVLVQVSAEPNHLSNLLVQCCAAYDPQRSGFLPLNKVPKP